MDESKKLFSERLKTVKLLTSSLFARKQPLMVVNGHQPGVFYFTNIKHDRVAVYRSTIEDVLSKVKITDSVVSNLYEAFPKFKEIVAEIDLNKFSSSLNQHLKFAKDVFPEIKVDEGSRKILMSAATDPKDASATTMIEIGTLLSDMDPDFYEDIINNYNKFSDNVIRRDFRIDQNNSDEKLMMEVVEIVGDKDKAEFALPIKDGFSMVSAKEYCLKRKLDPLYHLSLRMDPTALTSKAIIDYCDDWVDSMTIMPGSLWFMSRLGLV